MILSGILSVLAFCLLVPIGLLFFQTILALFPVKHLSKKIQIQYSVVILMPAHNESAVLLDTLNSIFPQLKENDRVLVVADNCSDDTATIARNAGAEVIERVDLHRRGKSYALDFGVKHLRANPPEVVIIVDADCLVSNGAISTLTQECIHSDRPIQSLYLMNSPNNSSLKFRIAEFAWLVKDQVRPLGYLRLGMPCQLMGSGMAFPWSIISKATLASGHLAEDLKLGLELTALGKAPLFCPDALVTSTFPESAEGSQTQRARWEHGHLGMIVSDAPKLLLQAILKGNVQLMAMVLDMCVPPLALLLLIIFFVWVMSGLHFWVSASALPLFVSSVDMLLLGCAVLFSWWRFGRCVLRFSDLAYAPIYTIKKIPLYLKFMLGKKVEWIRTKRD